MGYFDKYQKEFKNEHGILIEKRTTPHHVPQYDLVKFLDKEVRRLFEFIEGSGCYDLVYTIGLEELKELSKDNLFAKMILEAHGNNHLMQQAGLPQKNSGDRFLDHNSP